MKKWLLMAVLCLLPAVGSAQTLELPMDLSGGMPYLEEGRLAENQYEDESISVTVETMTWEQTTCYVARVKIAHPSQLRTAPAYAFNRSQTAPIGDIAKRVNAVLAINGDYCAYQLQSGSYLLRQGTLYANDPNPVRDILIIDRNGDFTIEHQADKETMAQYAPDDLANCFNFGPALVVNGEKLSDDYRADFNYSEERHRRAAIAQVKKGELEYLCICTDGPREEKDGGLTIGEFAELVYSLGVEMAYNLDGGNTTSMLLCGDKQNAILQGYHRPMSDIIYFASAVSTQE